MPPEPQDRVQWTEVAPGVVLPLLDGLYDVSLFFPDGPPVDAVKGDPPAAD